MRISVASDRNGAFAFALGRAVVGLGIVVSGLAAVPAAGVGGEHCGNATVIPSLPYTDTGTTCGALNHYHENCPGVTPNAPDLVYRYVAPSNGCIQVSLCNVTDFDARVYVYASGGCPPLPPPPPADTPNDIVCADGGCPAGQETRPLISNLAVAAGVTYYIVVDGSATMGACGNYQIQVTACGCTGPQDCFDGNDCTADVCQSGACQNPFEPATTACGNPADTGCDNPDTCNGAGQCLPNSEPVGTACGNPADTECDDPDSCDGSGQCLTNLVAADSPCGNPANTDCDNPDSCNGAGQCQANQEPNGTACDDGQFCTLDDQCSGGACAAGQPRICNDGLVCTDDSCNEEADVCQFNPSGDCCQSFQDCDDGDPCTLDQCNQGVCFHPPAAVGTPCGDPGTTTCTAPDTCDGAGTCQPNHVADGGPCDDGDGCTIADACSNGFCVGASDSACAECAQGGSPADPTNQVSFQAVLRNAGGQLIDGSVDLVFRFYDDQSTPVGAPIPVNDVGVANGILTTAIPIAETIFDGTARELGISIDGTPELSPRIRVTSTPQAFRVGCVDGSSVTPHLGIGNETEGGALRLVGPGTGQGGRGAFASTQVNVDTTQCGGTLSLYDSDLFTGEDEEDPRTVYLNACNGPGGSMDLSASDGTETVRIYGGSDGSGGAAEFNNRNANPTVILEADGGDYAAELTLLDGTTPAIELDADDDYGQGGIVWLRNENGDRTVEIDGSESEQEGVVRLFDSGGNEAIVLDAEDSNEAGQISLLNDAGKTTVQIVGAENATGANGGQIQLRKADGTNTITLDAEHGDNGPGRIITDQLEIRGGCDLSEQFDIDAPSSSVLPGMVVSIDRDNPGKLVVSSRPYDPTVAGIISGAGGINPGLLMGQKASLANGQHAVALTGRVYCLADESNGVIEPGDLLTTSSTPGYAMKATDRERAFGATLGKAMSRVDSQTGLVLVLVSLQ